MTSQTLDQEVAAVTATADIPAREQSLTADATSTIMIDTSSSSLKNRSKSIAMEATARAPGSRFGRKTMLQKFSDRMSMIRNKCRSYRSVSPIENVPKTVDRNLLHVNYQAPAGVVRTGGEHQGLTRSDMTFAKLMLVVG